MAIPAPVPFTRNTEGGADAIDSDCTLSILALSCGFAAADNKLTVYTYESFTAEWGPGPKVEAAFEKQCGCDLEFVAIADGVAILNRLKLEGKSTKADIVLGLDTNLTADAEATVCLFRMRLTLPVSRSPVATAMMFSLPFDFAHFAVIYDSEKVKNPPKSLAELIAGDPAQKIVIQDRAPRRPDLDWCYG